MMSTRWHLKSNNSGWFRPATVHVSTVEMPRIAGIDFGYKYESCVFGVKFDYDNESYNLEGSDVVSRYDTVAEATAGHVALCRKYGIKT